MDNKRLQLIKEAWQMPDGKTHYPDCELSHYTCAIQRLVAELESARETLKEAQQLPPSYVSQQVAMDCQEFLNAAGYGEPGQPNTLWAMVRTVTKDVVAMREACKKALTCASLDSSVRALIVAALSAKAGEE